MVLYGIKVNNNTLLIIEFFFDLTNKGEANAIYNTNKYVCTFSKMIQYWRQIWHERTNGSTDIEFPFGFVQVSFIRNHEKYDFYIDRWLKLIDIF
jgi:sialate O-acetylesterase